MCGICGFIGETTEREQVLERMMRAIRHRGPEGSDAYFSRKAALGFQRLSIIDPDQGMQPMYNETGSKVLVFNGEIYNYQALREELIQRKHIFKSLSDSEVLLHGYEEYGTGLLEKLRGMFGFAVWDEEKAELFAARDFFGIKPFYYAVVDHVLVFASEIKSILEYPGYQRKVNEEALEQYLSFQYSVLPETFFQGIYQLPGHMKGKGYLMRGALSLRQRYIWKVEREGYMNRGKRRCCIGFWGGLLMAAVLGGCGAEKQDRTVVLPPLGNQVTDSGKIRIDNMQQYIGSGYAENVVCLAWGEPGTNILYLLKKEDGEYLYQTIDTEEDIVLSSIFVDDRFPANASIAPGGEYLSYEVQEGEENNEYRYKVTVLKY